MKDRRPAWAMPPWVPERIGRALPYGSELVVPDALADGTGDGVPQAAPSVLAAVEGADVYLGYGVSPEILNRGRRLRWVHSGSAGVGSSLSPEMMATSVPFTNSAGVHAPPMAETALGMILHFARGLDLAVREQARGQWAAATFWSHDVPLRELSQSTVGILGFGGIGRELARRVAALGARVLVLRRRREGTEESTLPALGGGEVGVRVLHGSEGLQLLLGESDFLVLAAPQTSETEGLLNREALASMKPSSVLINVAREGSWTSELSSTLFPTDACGGPRSTYSPGSRFPRAIPSGRFPTCSSPRTFRRSPEPSGSAKPI